MRLLTAFSAGSAVLGLVEALPRISNFARRQAGELRAEYDFVIIGGGTAGLTVADRLSAALPHRKSSPFLGIRTRLATNPSSVLFLISVFSFFLCCCCIANQSNETK